MPESMPQPEPPPEVRAMLWPGEAPLWWGRSDPGDTVLHLMPNLLVSALWLGYAFGAPYVTEAVEWFLHATVKVGTAGFREDVHDVTLTVFRTLLGLAGLFLGFAGLSGVASWLVSFRRAFHAVTPTRVVSGTANRYTATYLRNVGMVRSRSGRFGRDVLVGIAGLGHQHAIVGVRDADAAAAAIDGALRRLRDGEGTRADEPRHEDPPHPPEALDHQDSPTNRLSPTAAPEGVSQARSIE